MVCGVKGKERRRAYFASSQCDTHLKSGWTRRWLKCTTSGIFFAPRALHLLSLDFWAMHCNYCTTSRLFVVITQKSVPFVAEKSIGKGSGLKLKTHIRAPGSFTYRISSILPKASNVFLNPGSSHSPTPQTYTVQFAEEDWRKVSS